MESLLSKYKLKPNCYDEVFKEEEQYRSEYFMIDQLLSKMDDTTRLNKNSKPF